GMVTPGPAGFSGTAVVECFRLLDSPPAKSALLDFPGAELVVIVSDLLYQDVIRNGFGNLQPEDFWPVRSSLPDKGFTANAWVYVSDRRDGPAAPLEQPLALTAEPAQEIVEARGLIAKGQARGALRLLETVTTVDAALLDTRADALIAADDHERARADLAELLNLQPDPGSALSASALLRLGRCQARLGDDQTARYTWSYLLEHQPLMTEAYLELGRLELRAGKYATAQNYLVEGLRMIRSDRDAPDQLLDDLVQELAGLPVVDG
ncbi:MAG: tetratricopeptide repeat protein, partial [Streptosporangiaceae bacterium]